MSTNLPGTGIAILGTILIFAVIAGGCTGSPYGQAPTTTPVTTAPATPPPATGATPVATTVTTPPPITTTVQTTAAPVSAAITIQNFAFIPASVTVPAGSTITWTNLDAAAHQVGSDTMAFTGHPMSQNSSYTFTFTTRGTFPYHCVIHPSMKGTITVT
ncbi:MAG: cupredoxin domain-containing protein [Methanomicrobiales archaeon]|nr:cupredoxin domain-containing protein [Methanomicrobiales archaeon]